MQDEHEVEVVEEGEAEDGDSEYFAAPSIPHASRMRTLEVHSQEEEEDEEHEETDEHVHLSAALPHPRTRTAKEQAPLKDEGDPTKTCAKCLEQKPLDPYAINNTKYRPCKNTADRLRRK
jgi:hypothetical protein